MQSARIPCRKIVVPEGPVPREQAAGSQLCQEVSTFECHPHIFKVAEQYTPGAGKMMTQQLRALAALPKDICSAPSMVGRLPTCCTGFHALFLLPQALSHVSHMCQMTEAHIYKK